MTFAITIGCYRALPFIELNIKRCRTIFGKTCSILLSDDLSEESPHIEAMAAKYGCHYNCSSSRRSHFSGDWQAMVNAVAFADYVVADYALKLSQRLIPALPEFKACFLKAFFDPLIQVALPGRPNQQQIARPGARFYTAFGILTDVIAIRRGAITGQEMIDIYRKRFKQPKARTDCLVEMTWGWLLEHRFKDGHVILTELANHVPFTPKIYLRKAQSTPEDYRMVGTWEGLAGNYDLREWAQIEGRNYFCRPTEV